MPKAKLTNSKIRESTSLNKLSDKAAVLLLAEPIAAGSPPDNDTIPAPNVFQVYERNIQMLTPVVSDKLRDAVKTYPEQWIFDAITEAAELGKRSWRYIEAILERWQSEGKSSGKQKPKKPEEKPQYRVVN